MLYIQFLLWMIWFLAEKLRHKSLDFSDFCRMPFLGAIIFWIWIRGDLVWNQDAGKWEVM